MVNLASYLARSGRRVLVVDLDPQGNATSGLGLASVPVERSIHPVLVDGADALDRVVPVAIEGLSIIPSSRDLAGAEVELVPVEGRERRLARALRPLTPSYDTVLLDCPPSLGLLTVNALTAADSVLIPIQCEYYALEGLGQLLSTIELVRAHLNPGLAIKGVLLTMFDARTTLSADVSAEVRRHLPDQVFRTRHPAQRPAGRGAVLRSPHLRARTRLEGRPGIPRPRRGAAPARRRPVAAARRPAADPGTRMGDPVVTTDTRRPRAGLGRGLASLIPVGPSASAPPADAPVREVPIERILVNPYQPRGTFHEADLEALAQSIATHGVLQPVLLTETPEGLRLIAGERRLRASRLAGRTTIPAVIRSADEQQQLAFALVENLQRSDLNALDEAKAFRRLIDEFGLTQEQVAQQVGRTRAAVSNTLRLLSVAPALQDALRAGRITEGHARALAGLADHADQERLLALVEQRGLSVRQTEQLVRRAATLGRCDVSHEAARAPRERPGPGAHDRPSAGDPRHEGRPDAGTKGRPDHHRLVRERRPVAAVRAPRGG